MGWEGDEETLGPAPDPQDGGGRGHLKTSNTLRQEVKITPPPTDPQDGVGGG